MSDLAISTAPTLRLAYVSNPPVQRAFTVPYEDPPALLVSYVFLEDFLARRSTFTYRDWVLDSGAFTAFNRGITIDVARYADEALRLKAEDPKLIEVFSLDVIGDVKASERNTDYLWSRGIEAIPCYHAGEDESVLLRLARDYPKIALGGVAMLNAAWKFQWAKQCFARVWPKRIHGFSYLSEQATMGLPWESVDGGQWFVQPLCYGTWRGFDTKRVSVRGSGQDLEVEVRWYIELEKKVQARWRREMKVLRP